MKIKHPLLALALVMALQACDPGFRADGIHYLHNGDGVTVAPLMGKSYIGDVLIPDTVVSNDSRYPVNGITFNAFCGAKMLCTVSLPPTVRFIAPGAFRGCVALRAVYCPVDTPLTIDSTVFAGVNPRLCRIYVPVGSDSLYRAAPVWSRFTIIAQGPDPHSLN